MTPTPTTKAKKPRRSKVAEACRFCRRSHMSCDAGRPCGRCVKRDIAHLCTEDNPIPPAVIPEVLPPPPPLYSSPVASGSGSLSPAKVLTELSEMNSNGLGLENFSNTNGVGLNGHGANSRQNSYNHYNSNVSMPLNSNFNLAMLDLASGQDGMGAGLGLGDLNSDLNQIGDGGEFQGLGLSEFLQSLNQNSVYLTSLGAPSTSQISPTLHSPSPHNLNRGLEETSPSGIGIMESLQNNHSENGMGASFGRRDTAGSGSGLAGIERGASARESASGSGALSPPINKTEKFFNTAADQVDGSRSDRLARVIHAKFEAGLLKPYNHVAGYTRLMRWMADNMSPSSKQRTLQTLSEFRPAFRAIASGLTDLDLVFIEEAFERLLLDYDRVFSSMGIPSCLWRRTGEIYKGNKEFAALVGVPIEQLRDGKLAIYELMAEESAVNYWEKYGDIAFDAGQKAVLTSCVLINQSALSRKRKKFGNGGERERAKQREDCMINCCFSFTIRRDSYAIPSMIVGNFLRF